MKRREKILGLENYEKKLYDHINLKKCFEYFRDMFFFILFTYVLKSFYKNLRNYYIKNSSNFFDEKNYLEYYDPRKIVRRGCTIFLYNKNYSEQ